jgi:hypothetical protein
MATTKKRNTGKKTSVKGKAKTNVTRMKAKKAA